MSPAKNCSSVAALHAVVLTKAGATLDLAFVAAYRRVVAYQRALNSVKERGSDGALRLPGTWTNGANGSSDIEGKAVMGNGE